MVFTSRVLSHIIQTFRHELRTQNKLFEGAAFVLNLRSVGGCTASVKSTRRRRAEWKQSHGLQQGWLRHKHHTNKTAEGHPNVILGFTQRLYHKRRGLVLGIWLRS